MESNNNEYKNFSFDGQKPDENIFLIVRQHPLTFYKEAALLIASIVILTLVVFFQSGFGGIFSYVFFIALIANGYVWLKQIYCWTKSIYIITSTRIISFDQRGFFYRAMTEATLDKIQNISHIIKGAVRTIFNFGTVIIQTAGQNAKDVTLEDIPHPLKIQQEIMDIASEYGGAPIKVELDRDKIIR
ncbi:MAG: hypothetical protein CEN91_549 [Candidatus Berkelbacteria bacterium Licking1014_85]|uniref:YdbS-like PH domain-containing protein n=1 Tax=Candidatus Berkelbacteria bacterium Licking1014_85 TaxID=2017148 RepID=A0A554LH10_9BACT|nr:MAG: hypothetical protein CEN91_549 [Candidatus Berkelbacteria bacterium Licking1014_85]